MDSLVKRFRDMGLAFNLDVMARPSERMVSHLQRPLESHMDTNGLELRNVEHVEPPLLSTDGSSTFSKAWQFMAVHPHARPSAAFGGPALKPINDVNTDEVTIGMLNQRARKKLPPLSLPFGRHLVIFVGEPIIHLYLPSVGCCSLWTS